MEFYSNKNENLISLEKEIAKFLILSVSVYSLERDLI